MLKLVWCARVGCKWRNWLGSVAQEGCNCWPVREGLGSEVNVLAREFVYSMFGAVIHQKVAAI